ncbi:hypothetical protein KNO81_23215 [Paraburkholderia sediminicola]|nr:hypothetical protein [Paraburkholderia sediminicola]
MANRHVLSRLALNRSDVCEQSCGCAKVVHGTGTIDGKGTYVSNIQRQSRQRRDFGFAERHSDWRKSFAEAVLLTFLMLAGAA